MTAHTVRRDRPDFIASYYVTITDAPHVRSSDPSSYLMQPTGLSVTFNMGSLDWWRTTFRGPRVLKDGSLSDKVNLNWSISLKNLPAWAMKILDDVREDHFKRYQHVVELIAERNEMEFGS